MSADLPRDKKTFAKAFPKFRAWLLEHGSAIYEPTNSYEIARFLTADGIGVVYINASGRITSWQNGALKAYSAYVSGEEWRARHRTRRKRTDRDYAALIARDGNSCMYCGEPQTEETATVEHVVSVTHGGPNHLANKAISCKPCNTRAGHLSAREKLEMAISQRLLKSNPLGVRKHA